MTYQYSWFCLWKGVELGVPVRSCSILTFSFAYISRKLCSFLLMFHADPVCLPPSNFSFQPSCLTIVILTGFAEMLIVVTSLLSFHVPKASPFLSVSLQSLFSMLWFPATLSVASPRRSPDSHLSLFFFFFTASFRPPTLTLLHALLIRFIFLPFPLIQSQAPQAKCLKLSALSPTSLSGSFPVSLSSPSPQFHIPPSSHSSCLDSPCLSIFSSHPIQTPGTLCVILSWFALLSWLWWNCISC